MHPNQYSIDLENQIVDLYGQGLDCNEIATIVGVKYNTSVRRVLIRRGVKLVSSSERRRYVNHNPFNNLNDPETQYWLGYIASDGHINKKDGIPSEVILSTVKDPEQLQEYISFLKSPKLTVRKHYNEKYNLYEYNVGFRNTEVAQYVCDLGITPKKSITLEMLIPITWDFVRGYFDGNGSISKNSLTIATGSITFAMQLSKFFTDESIEHALYTYNQVNVHTLRIKAKHNTLVVSKMYPLGYNQKPCLHRKLKKAMLLCSST